MSLIAIDTQTAAILCAVILLTTGATALGLVVTRLFPRNAAVRHCVLFSVLLCVLVSPFVQPVMARCGLSLFTFPMNCDPSATKVRADESPSLPRDAIRGSTVANNVSTPETITVPSEVELQDDPPINSAAAAAAAGADRPEQAVVDLFQIAIICGLREPQCSWRDLCDAA